MYPVKLLKMSRAYRQREENLGYPDFISRNNESPTRKDRPRVW